MMGLLRFWGCLRCLLFARSRKIDVRYPCTKHCKAKNGSVDRDACGEVTGMVMMMKTHHPADLRVRHRGATVNTRYSEETRCFSDFCTYSRLAMPKLTNNKANTILDAAAKGKYGVPAMCVVSSKPTDIHPKPQNNGAYPILTTLSTTSKAQLPPSAPPRLRNRQPCSSSSLGQSPMPHPTSPPSAPPYAPPPACPSPSTWTTHRHPKLSSRLPTSVCSTASWST